MGQHLEELIERNIHGLAKPESRPVGDVVLEDGRRRRRSQGGYTVTFFSHFGRGRRLVDALLPKDAMPVRERISELKKEAWWGVDV
ncbi:hypothetical protein C351_01766 [Cryptococcus neoformans c8]|nr:hypothetical protein C351_01766 [Cryptococcus neoformans var. grubii c8]